MRTVLVVNDVIAMLIAFTLAMFFGHKAHFTLNLLFSYSNGFLALAVNTLLVFFILDFYSLRKMPERILNQMTLSAFGLLLSSILSTFVFFFFRNPVPRAVFILFYVFSWLFIILFRMHFKRATRSVVYWRILIVGDKKASEDMARLIRKRTYLHSHVVGYLPCCGPPDPGKELVCLGSLDGLVQILRQQAIDQIIVATANMDQELNHALLEAMKLKVKVSDYRSVMESVAGKVPVDFLDDYWFILSLAEIDKSYFWYAKRGFDVLVSLFGLCVALLLLPLVALLIKLDSRGPVFYSQDRVGRAGKPFRVWKLRTMVEGADTNNVHWTTDNDDRITKVGRFIRKTRLDELPQLYNILKGEMSLIGPRPEAESLSKLYEKEIAYYRERHRVTPGITGWAQINFPYGNSLEDAREKLKYDFYYIKHRNLLLDAAIFLRTIRIVLTGKGAL